MKKLIKTMTVAVLMTSSAVALTLEDYDKYIAEAKNPANKQTLICEREARYIFKDPMLCKKAAQISPKEYYAVPFDGYEDYKNYASAMYANAGVIYDKIGDNANKIIMYKKALEFLPNYDVVHNNLGTAYYFGNGVETNKIKAYEHFRIAAKQGNQLAQRKLDFLCNESPWACK